MARSRPSILKRNRERKRQEKRMEKAARRQERAQERRDRPEDGVVVHVEEEDPDIAGIVPGPQPLPWEDQVVDDDP